MNHLQLFNHIVQKRSFLCVGLDSEFEKIPSFLKKLKNPVFEFNKRIIDSTHEYAVAYKPNVAFYESLGSEGWLSLEATVKYIRKKYPDIFIIADAKRSDIGNTSKMYAKTFLENMPFDAVTVAPYMGEDSNRVLMIFNITMRMASGFSKGCLLFRRNGERSII
jgi:orotidine-5'-phosphate decarboxylase